jgi:lantibiotic modifying enzyme
MWEPIFSEGEREDVLSLALELAEAVRRVTPKPLEAPLPAGTAGQAILFGDLADLLGREDEYYPVARERLELAVAAIAEHEMPYGLHAGYLGTAWAVAHLGPRLLEEDEDPCQEIDEELLAVLARSPWPDDYDLVSGLVGIGVYALERLPASSSAAVLLEGVVRQLSTLSEVTADGVTWLSRPHTLIPSVRALYPTGIYNLGLAHGVPGVVSLLASAHAAGVPGATPLLTGGVEWLLAERRKNGDAAFGYYANATGRAQPRMAWCYGDPGVATALWQAGLACGETRWSEEALRIAERAARADFNASGVRDAGICHGSVGLAHIFQRFYCATLAPRFRDAARTWIQHTFALRRNDLGVCGYQTWPPEADNDVQLISDLSFLNGVCGVALVLASAVAEREPCWDRCLLLSSPTLRPGARNLGPLAEHQE